MGGKRYVRQAVASAITKDRMGQKVLEAVVFGAIGSAMLVGDGVSA